MRPNLGMWQGRVKHSSMQLPKWAYFLKTYPRTGPLLLIAQDVEYKPLSFFSFPLSPTPTSTVSQALLLQTTFESLFYVVMISRHPRLCLASRGKVHNANYWEAEGVRWYWHWSCYPVHAELSIEYITFYNIKKARDESSRGYVLLSR